MTEITHKLEDYIEAIYLLKEKTKLPVRIKEIAAFLNVNKTTVVSAVKKLKENGMITQEHYGYILLTSLGEQTAIEIYSKHSVIKDFLIQVLNFNHILLGNIDYRSFICYSYKRLVILRYKIEKNFN